MKKFNLKFFYLLSFVEGGLMLTTELASERKIAVFFGSSLYVWLIILCITMIGLAFGYYWANHLIEKNKSGKPFQLLSVLFLILSINLVAWKFNSNLSLFLIHLHIGLIPSVIIDSLLLLFIPMFIYGAVTTFVIHLSQQLISKPVYGKILAYSTLGSVLFGVISVLWAFPFMGIQTTIFALSIISLLLSFKLYSVSKWLLMVWIIALIIPNKKIRKNILYENDGTFSSVMVVQEHNTRYLLVNYIIQSFYDAANNKTLMYAQIMDSVLKAHQWTNKNVLILGLGGGIIANKLSLYNNQITGVEIDGRIIQCAKNFFDLNPKVKTVCEDAQWFIHQSKDKYNIIVMDLFNGEEPPAYILTKENFYRIKQLLENDSGLVVINWYGYYKHQAGKGTRVLLNTLQKAGFHTSCISTGNDEKTSNILIFASLHSSHLPKSNIDVNPENIENTYEKNILSYLNAEANFYWRKGYLQFIQHWWN